MGRSAVYRNWCGKRDNEPQTSFYFMTHFRSLISSIVSTRRKWVDSWKTNTQRKPVEARQDMHENLAGQIKIAKHWTWRKNLRISEQASQ